MKIYNLKPNSLNENDRLELAKLLIKAGYAVKLGRERPSGSTAAYTHYVEYWEENKNG